MIKFFRTDIGEEELKEVNRVVKTGWYGNGPECKQFEKELGEKFGSPYVLTTNSCTSALFLSMKILDIGEGDEVIIPTVHFPGALNAILDVGATPKFADVDVRTLNIIPEDIKLLKTKKTKAVMLLHYGGHPCDLNVVQEYSKGLRIIEDNANSPGSIYKGKYCGTLGDIGCYSFDSMKIMTMVDGGALTFKDRKLYEKAVSLRFFGSAKSSMSGFSALKEGKDKWWEQEFSYVSGRHISNDILAAIGRVQLRKLDGFIERRKEIWDRYQEEFKDIEWLRLPPEPLQGTTSSYYLYWLGVTDRDRFAKYLISKEIYCTFKYQPLHLIPFYRNRIRVRENLIKAEWVDDFIINVPIHNCLTDEEVGHIIKTVKEFK